MDMNHLLWLLIFDVAYGLARLLPQKAEQFFQGGEVVTFAAVRAF